MRSQFKDDHPFGMEAECTATNTAAETRKAEAERIREKYVDRIPVSQPAPHQHRRR